MSPIVLDLDAAPWQAIHDGVMGGVSRGRMERAGELLRFSGELSLENNGGFASVRRELALDLSGLTTVTLRVRGDGRHYQCRLHTDDLPRGGAWVAWFQPSESWQQMTLPLESFEPRLRGRTLPSSGPPNPARIRQLGFLIADKRAGPFALEIGGIRFVSGP